MNEQTFNGKYMKSVMKILDVFVIGLLLGLVAKGLSGWGGGWRVNHFVDIFGIYFWYFWDWLVVGVDCKRAKWMRWWLQGEPYCGYLVDIFGIFFQCFWEWLVVRVDCTRVKWVRWWLGGWTILSGAGEMQSIIRQCHHEIDQQLKSKEQWHNRSNSQRWWWAWW